MADTAIPADSAPPKIGRKGIGFIEAAERFGDDESAQEWIISERWPDGVKCPSCGSDGPNSSAAVRFGDGGCKSRRDCGKNFTVKTDTIMHDSKLPVWKWCIAVYLYSTNLKGISAKKLRRELGIGSYKNAWHMAHRIRRAMDMDENSFLGPVEVDEVYIGGKERNKHEWQRLNAGRGAVGKTPVVALKDRETNKVVARVVEKTDQPTLTGFVSEYTEPATEVFTDEFAGYNRLPRSHKIIRHSAKEFVRGEVHTNGIESWFSMLKRGYVGVYHNYSVKHLPRYIAEAVGRHKPSTARHKRRRCRRSSWAAVGKRLPYEALIGPEHTRQPELI